MEDIMLIRSSFLRRIISQIINKMLKKQLPGTEVSSTALITETTSRMVPAVCLRFPIRPKTCASLIFGIS